MFQDSIITTGKEIINKGKELFLKLTNKSKKDKESIDETTKNNNIDQTISISSKQFKILQDLIKSIKTRTDVKERARLIVKYYFDNNISRCTKELNTSRKKVKKWVTKWKNNQTVLDRTELKEIHNLKSQIISVLSDDYRTGKPPTIQSEQIAAIIYLSLQEPSEFGLPISHWTGDELKEIAIKLKIVDKITARQINRYLKQAEINIYKYDGWLNSQESNPNFEEYQARVKKVCDTYKDSENYEKNGIAILSTDEKTGIQAIKHKHPAKPIQVGSCKKIEQEYERKGTTTLIASRDINTGKIIPMLNPTRTEEDFVVHIKEVLKNYKKSKEIILIMDQLNTHMSESMVKLIAQECKIDKELGIKGKKGILKSKKTRAEFLEDGSHRVRIVYTPKHCSWLNQIELWFGILSKQLLNRRVSFNSVDELNSKIEDYIEYYNDNLAKKFVWNYNGKILKV
jgi:transposase